MSYRRNSRTHTGPPPGMSERRQGLRREEDEEKHTIADAAVSNSWLINKIIHWSKIAAAIVVLLAASNGVLGALNIRMVGSKEDVRTLRMEMARNDTALRKDIGENSSAIISLRSNQDSIVKLLTNMNNRIERWQIIQCLRDPTISRTTMCRP